MSDGPSVQSVDRAIDLLEGLTDLGGSAALSELAEAAQLPLPTIHRLMRTLVMRGYARQLPSRRYTLGPRLIRLGESSSEEHTSELQSRGQLVCRLLLDKQN